MHAGAGGPEESHVLIEIQVESRAPIRSEHIFQICRYFAYIIGLNVHVSHN